MFFGSYFIFIWFSLQHAEYVFRRGGQVNSVDAMLFFAFTLFVGNIFLFGWSVYKRWLDKGGKKKIWIWGVVASVFFYMLGCCLAEAFFEMITSV